ncbi:PREDICTED: uncharacterized protein LOC106324311 [Brassica oleracea var. oleracea]|uniref:uncharacterized protein LOC106324311 n=1 Tax=Brassica oleracea var. oleracea TaxID=109376 RepID=UPI0006A6CF1A|nr:PREDICTED: uncharacterized protein LOC106324311 [Brassica oleracea var. oleracea]
MEGGGEEEVSIKELASNLTTYKEQLQQVRQLLSEDPRNSEYADMEKELKENVIDLNNALLEAERLAEATKNALKRKIEQAASSDYQSKTLPAKLKIDPNDPEDVKIAKRRKIHAFKSKARQEQLEVAQNTWQQFQTTKKVGFYTGRKKESIFKSPEDPFGKVGVIGSGKGLTDFQKREKHLHLKSGNAEGIDE